MINNSPPGVARHQGLTLLELTMCIASLMFLNSIMFIASHAWKRCGDRASCMLTLRNMQVATRSFQNLYGYNYGSSPAAEDGTQDIATLMYSKEFIDSKLYRQATGSAPCPAGGSYIRVAADLFPPSGQLYVTCSLSASAGHVPSSHEDW